MEYSIYAVDVGSPSRGNFAWARIRPGDGDRIGVSTCITKLVDELRTELGTLPVALGFESPLFIPVPDNAGGFCKKREGEGNRHCFAGAGATSALTGLQEAAWLLEKIWKPNVPVSFSLSDWNREPERRSLLVWEAFVSGDAKAQGGSSFNLHERDAATAADAFRRCSEELDSHTGIQAHNPLSIIGAALLWAGWGGMTGFEPQELLHKGVVFVARPERAVEPERLVAIPPAT